MTEARDEKRRRRWLLWLLLLILLLLLVVCGVLVTRDGPEERSEPTSEPPPGNAIDPTVASTALRATTTSSTMVPTTSTTSAPPEPGVTGLWIFTINVTDVEGSVCQGEIGDEYEREVTISGTDDQLTLIGLDDLGDPGDPAWSGTFEAGILRFDGTRAEDDGLTSASFELSLSADGQSLEGIEEWTWDWTSRGETGTCTGGKSTVTAIRSAP